MKNREECICVSKHVPLPTILFNVYTTNGVEVVCPTTYWNLQKLQQEYFSHEGKPPGSIRKHYSEYVQNLTKRSQPEGGQND